MNLKKVIITILLSVPMSLSAQHTSEYYIGINPLAPLTSISNQYTNLYLPLISNLETGLSLNAGIKKNMSAYEIRYSLGKPNKMYFLNQVHIGYNYFISSKKRMYVGSFLKYYSLHNLDKKIKNNSLVPYLTVGYNYYFKNCFIDFRLNQNIYAISWSNQNNLKVNSGLHFSIFKELSPVVPYLSINVGYVFPKR